MFTKVLIANRGEIACRIIATLKKLDIRSVAVYSEADAHALHVQEADEAVCIGPSAPADSYLRTDRILDAALSTGAEAIHPGYGFLSENADFAEQCAAHGVVFIGPTPDMLRQFGLKHTARALAEANRVPLLPGTDLLSGIEQAESLAEVIGYPVMLKSTAGGGGIGMRLCRNKNELQDAFGIVQRLSAANFKDGGLYLEKFVQRARHLEVQIFGDGRGRVLHLGERDCSVQRRNQKVIEETPAPNLPEAMRDSLYRHALALTAAVNYRSAGTVEFVYDEDASACYFLEVNTRLQVEHGVTEAVTGVDLVEWMLRLAAGESDFLDTYRHRPQGAAMQVRVYAEDPNKNFQPSAGLLTDTRLPQHIRVDHWLENGLLVTPHYDPLLAKIIVHGDTRATALLQMETALDATHLAGIETNLAYLRQIVADSIFRGGRQTTAYLNQFRYCALTIDVLEAGTQSMIQDYPGRLGYWDVGVPPSGPMDPFAFRLANRILGNAEDAAGLEMTIHGPTLRFNLDARIALTGAAMSAELNGEAVPFWQPVVVKAGDTLKLGGIIGQGCRTYLAVSHGFDVPEYLGSRATFALGKFGGHGGRALRVGDVLAVRKESSGLTETRIRKAAIPDYRNDWTIGVLYGPHGAPDFFTEADIEQFFSTAWEVHYNSNRTGIRLIGPKPEWARPDGGEAGLHPSNIHDNAYAVGTVDFTGDMPVILGPDGPSLGGFVCPATVVGADLWKLGQLKPGDTIRFHRLTREEAAALDRSLEQFIAAPEQALPPQLPARTETRVGEDCVLKRLPESPASLAVIYRQAGDSYLLVEYGPLVLDLNLRFRIHALVEWLRTERISGIVDLTPGIRSLQIHYDRRLPLSRLMDILAQAEAELPAIDEMEVPSRIVHLPLSWDDPSTRLAIEKYMQSVRKDAPWCPSNIEFIRRINGLDSIEQVREILFDASYLVLGLGDVYLGAPVATPIDPRHRLVTTKYNPARTWTPENAVGIGGAYLCVYGMEGPGGYQFVGRTVPMWNHYRQTADFQDGKPWLLRFFDQIRFFPVTADELLRYREDVTRGRIKLDIREETFSLRRYNEFLRAHAAEIASFKCRQQAAFDDERESWNRTGLSYADDHAVAQASADTELDLPAGARPVASHMAGNVWKVLAREGEWVDQGDPLVIVESMKMEFDILAPQSGRIWKVFCSEGGPIAAGQDLLILQDEEHA
ncbi:MULTISPECIES: urea carboxylase [Methylomicrobium]|uniref:Biotin carboxylase n=1 Tax=Methylomicrobium album BG8 TaxID=686340 RepID=H8GP12_METAL|nr:MULTISPECIES: urea carboxylase [Methylomicrobium]EIC28434.1 urea carboxylase [Methylomicrobium album BG8]